MECSIKHYGGELPAGDVGDVSAFEPHVFFVLLGAACGYVLSAKRNCSSFELSAVWTLKFASVCVFFFRALSVGSCLYYNLCLLLVFWAF